MSDKRAARGIRRRIFEACLKAYPREFRSEFGDDLLQTFDESIEATVLARRPVLPVVAAECLDTLRRGVAMRLGRPSQRPTGKRAYMDTMIREARLGLRSLIRQPLFAVGAITVLTIGIASNAAMFGLFDAYLLRPLPLPDSDRLYRTRFEPVRDMSLMMPLWNGVWEIESEEIESVVTWDLDGFTLVGDPAPTNVSGAWVSEGYFSSVGSDVALGRVLQPGDYADGAPSVAVISHRLWLDRFGGDSSVVGRTLNAFASDRPDESEIFEVVGVLPSDFWFVNGSSDFFAPLEGDRIPYIVKLPEGAASERAADYLTALARSQSEGLPDDWSVQLIPLSDSYLQNVEGAVKSLTAAIALVLLIATANVAIMFLLRGMAREKEIAVRRALGASRKRIALQLLTEGLLVSGIAAIAGVAIAGITLDATATHIQSSLGTSIPGGAEKAGLSLTVLLATTGAALLVGLLFSLAPIVRVSRSDLVTGLASSGRSGSATRGRQILRSTLVAVEIALSLALLVGTSLMIRTVSHLNGVDIGFDSSDVVVAGVSIRQRNYEDAEDLIEFTDRFIEELSALPDLQSVSLRTHWVFSGVRPTAVITDGGVEVSASVGTIAEDYFESLDIPIISGRTFDRTIDVAGSPRAAIVSEQFAASAWGDENPLGRTVRIDDQMSATVVGISGDILESLTNDDLPDVFLSFRQGASSFFFMMIEGRGATVAPGLYADMRQALTRVDPTAALFRISTMDALVGRAAERPGFLATVLAGFAGICVLLTTFGVYSLIAYTVSQSNRETAVRMALGAARARVTTHFVSRSVPVVAAGTAAGLALSLWLSRLLESQIFGVAHSDAVSHVGAAALLSGITLVAVWLSARRAGRTDIVDALRAE